jgi:hypothetical protein
MRILKQGLSYLRNHNNRPYATFVRDPESGEFKLSTSNTGVLLPQNVGYILPVTHDKKEDESKEDYKKRCVDLVKQHIKPGYYTFFACSTVIKEEPPGNINSVIQKFKDKKTLSQVEVQTVTPGHIGVYTSEESFVSHTPAFKQTQAEAISYDVENSCKEQQKVSTYLVVLSKECFSDPALNERMEQEAVFRQNRNTYHWGAVDDPRQRRDNCATRIQAVFLGRRDLNTMNPLDTLQTVISTRLASLSLSDDDYDLLAICYEQTGLNRSIPHVSWDEDTYQKGLTPRGPGGANSSH